MMDGKAVRMLIGVLVLAGISESSVISDGTDFVDNEIRKKYPNWDGSYRDPTIACFSRELGECVWLAGERECGNLVQVFHDRCASYTRPTSNGKENIPASKEIDRCRTCPSDFENKTNPTSNRTSSYNEMYEVLRDYDEIVSVASTVSDYSGICQTFKRKGCIRCDADTGEISQDYERTIYLPNHEQETRDLFIKVYPNGTYYYFDKEDPTYSWPGMYEHNALLSHTEDCFTIQHIVNGVPKWKQAFARANLPTYGKKACAKRIEQDGKAYFMCKP